MNQQRIRKLNNKSQRVGSILYWMSRDMRTEDNWAILFAQKLAQISKEPLMVLFCLASNFLGAKKRQYSFMIEGLKKVEKRLHKKNIPFFVKVGEPKTIIYDFVRQHKIGAVICDFDPLRIKRKWKDEVASSIDVPNFEVDAHNIVPCFVASPKKEYGAYTIRPKISRLLGEFLDSPERLQPQRDFNLHNVANDWQEIEKILGIKDADHNFGFFVPGEDEAGNVLKEFIEQKLDRYAEARNDPTRDAASNLSPYLHLGHISPLRVVLKVMESPIAKTAKEAFLEELIVRRELSDNYCFYEKNYDSFEGFPDWAKRTLNDHRNDPRPYLYTVRQFESAETHDKLWNAAQMEMVKCGKMAGYLRMYWAKKILEWTRHPEEAQEFAIYLNDAYELDGRDPNGYTGIAWSIGGVHDRAWGERPIFGKVRYMSERGARSKFDVEEYIRKINAL
ncbi:MAG: deoxyribodipyrimidine photo-lyase [Deltaproteobacteria bacterium]|uniref:Deoxyribodipyrimidine photo-lyase n=1 Tax=Candidatus Zymogenus saltonus TaxID=2844893 RepID=A0A9D8KE67_9DELT|nr:deoxyribodipyrimidine photo-lyase [Candidatus Zymogenus saltonus]